MKAKTFICSLLLSTAIALFPSCSEEQDIPMMTAKAENSKIENVIAIADNAYNCFFSNPTRAVLANRNSIVCVTNALSRSESTDTLLYIVNMGDEEGFVIVSSLENKNPVLGISDSGSIKDINDIDNPGMQMYLEDAKSYTANELIGGGLDIHPAFKHEILYLEPSVVVEPRVKVHWGRYYPQGLYCPNKNCGCVPLALAQALSYYETPTTLDLTYLKPEQRSVFIDWAATKKDVRSCSWVVYESTLKNTNTPITTIRTEEKLGQFCRELGRRMYARYDTITNQTGVVSENHLKRVVDALGVNLSITEDIHSTPKAKDEIAKDGIILMAGRAGESGHMWIIDGCKFIKEQHSVYYYNAATDTYDLTDRYMIETDYQHINWGSNGNCDGYFNVDVFDMQKGVQYDKNSGNTTVANFDHAYEYYVLKKSMPIISFDL